MVGIGLLELLIGGFLVTALAVSLVVVWFASRRTRAGGDE